MNNVFQKDVSNDIKWEKENIEKQIELLQPLQQSLHKTTGQKIINTGSYLFMELLCWVGAIASITWMVFAFNTTPFYEMSSGLHATIQSGQLTETEVATIEWVIRILIFSIAILLIILARQLAKLRKKAKITSVAGKTLLDMQNKLAERKSVLIAFEEKYQYLFDEEVNLGVDEFINPLDNNDYKIPPPNGDQLLD